MTFSSTTAISRLFQSGKFSLRVVICRYSTVSPESLPLLLQALPSLHQWLLSLGSSMLWFTIYFLAPICFYYRPSSCLFYTNSLNPNISSTIFKWAILVCYFSPVLLFMQFHVPPHNKSISQWFVWHLAKSKYHCKNTQDNIYKGSSCQFFRKVLFFRFNGTSLRHK